MKPSTSAHTPGSASSSMPSQALAYSLALGLGLASTGQASTDPGRIASVPTSASSWSEPHPLRREALLEGRDYDYNKISFMHRFSYRNIYQTPLAGQDGFRGTTGSVTSDMLFTDYFFQKTLGRGPQQVQVISQRSEDFDGHYDRHFLGFSHQLNPQLRLGLGGNIVADKAESDVYLEARWQPSEQRLLRMTMMAPDVLYNDKVRDNTKYQDKPFTWFVHGRILDLGAWWLEAALNYQPNARILDFDAGVDAQGRQLRSLLLIARTHQLAGQPWRSSLQWEQERTRRNYLFDRLEGPPADDFRRLYQMLQWQSQRQDLAWQPTWGLRYMRHYENGYTGLARDHGARELRREIGAYVGGRFQVRPGVQFTPSLHLAEVDLQRELQWGTGPVRDDRQWQAEMTMPWSFLLDAEQDAWISINITLQLHKLDLGGGNLQLHWPL